MTPSMIAVFVAACLTGAVIQCVTGFGFGIFVMTIFPFFMPSYVAGVTVSQLLSFTMTLYLAYTLRKEASFKLIVVPLMGYAVSNAVCVALSLSQSDAVLKKMLGVFLFLLSIYFVFFSDKVKIKPTKTNGVITGLLSGALSGMFGAGGPPIVIYLLSVTDSPRQYLANIQCFFALSSMYNLSMRVLNGMINETVLGYWVIGIPVVYLGIFIGKKVSRNIDAMTLKRLVYAFMAVSGLIMFFTA